MNAGPPRLTDDVVAELRRQRLAILPLLDDAARAELEAGAKGDPDELLARVGHLIFFLNVTGGTAEQIAELINRNYADDVPRSVDDALAIARGETAEAKAAREAREVEESEQADDDDDEVLDEAPEVPAMH